MYLVLDLSFCKPVLVLCWSLLHSLPYILISQSFSLSHPHYQIMKWIRVADRCKKFLPLKSECLLPCSQEHFTCPCCDQMNQSTPFSLTSIRYIVILSFHLRLGLPNSFFQLFWTKPYCHLYSVPRVQHAPSMLLSLIWLPKVPQLLDRWEGSQKHNPCDV